MNIFYLDKDPVKAAQAQCDKHVVKMVLESAQILSTASGLGYKSTHQNHPCTLWANETSTNYVWLLNHAIALCEEYVHRYKRRHKSFDTIIECGAYLPPDGDLTSPAQAMPDEFKRQDPVEAYRIYYRFKRHIIDMHWTNRTKPTWM